jgi:ABC-type multidrug transport system fused ATPase/permease subunit
MTISLKQYTELLSKYLSPQRYKVMWLGLLLCANIALQLYNPQVLRGFIDRALAGDLTDSLWGAAALFLGIALVSQALSIANAYLSQSVGWTATNALRADLAAHCLSLDMSFHKARTPGELIERIDGDINTLATFFSQMVLLVIGNALLLLGILVLLWWEDWRVGVMLTAFTTVMLYVLQRNRALAVPASLAMRQAHAKLYGFLEERLAGLDDIRANGAGAYTARRFGGLQHDVFQAVWKFEAWMAWIDIVTMTLFGSGIVIALALGAWLYYQGAMSVGAVFLIVRYTQMLRDPMQQIMRQLQEFQKATAAIIRSREFFNLRSQLPDGDKALVTHGALSVTFRNVSFEYDDTLWQGKVTTTDASTVMFHDTSAAVRANRNGNGRMTLHDIAFRLEAGKVLGLLGRTGSGKTTLARLLMRLYDPNSGAIELNDVNMRAVRLHDLRRHIGMVTQDVQLFHATLRDNLTLFRANVPEARILSAIEELGLCEWYRSLPDGLDTLLAPSGSGLSAGEAQLLSFARVLLRDPALVILDEASSRLDPATEQRIERAVDKLLRGRTGIIIAHRLATVQRADEILILDEGRIAEYGERVVLATNPTSRFAQLLRTGLEEVLV